MIIEFSDEPQTTTPKVFFNSSGWEVWGGKPAAALTDDEISALLNFCRREGSRQGFNDANRGTLGLNQDGPFDLALLDGLPAAEWRSHYWAGVVEQRSQIQDGPADDAPNDLFETNAEIYRIYNGID